MTKKRVTILNNVNIKLAGLALTDMKEFQRSLLLNFCLNALTDCPLVLVVILWLVFIFHLEGRKWRCSDG